MARFKKTTTVEVHLDVSQCDVCEHQEDASVSMASDALALGMPGVAPGLHAVSSSWPTHTRLVTDGSVPSGQTDYSLTLCPRCRPLIVQAIADAVCVLGPKVSGKSWADRLLGMKAFSPFQHKVMKAPVPMDPTKPFTVTVAAWLPRPNAGLTAEYQLALLVPCPACDAPPHGTCHETQVVDEGATRTKGRLEPHEVRLERAHEVAKTIGFFPCGCRRDADTDACRGNPRGAEAQ